MAKTNLKRMNRFELLELMYRLVVENESLSQRCEELEAMLGSPQRVSASRPARESYGYEDYRESQPLSRREEIMARVEEQTYRPQPRREVEPQQSRASPRQAPSAKPAPAGKRSEAPVAKPAVPAEERRYAAAQPTQPKAKGPSRQASQPRSAARPPVKEVPKKPVQDNMDLDSILEDFFKEFPPESGKGGAS